MFHVISRCVGGQFLLDHAHVRDAYVDLLGRAAERTDARVLAYCVMSNHIHLVVVQGDHPLERLYKPVNTGIAWHANRRRRGTGAKGPVIAQCPRCVLVDQETYLLELVRYVHNNPVRAKLVRRASQSTWSSHRAYLGLEDCPAWLHSGYVLERFGRQRRRAVEAFDTFVRDGAREKRRPDLAGEALEAAQASAVRTLGDGIYVGDGVLGDEAFLERPLRPIRRERELGPHFGEAGLPVTRFSALVVHGNDDELVLEPRENDRVLEAIEE